MANPHAGHIAEYYYQWDGNYLNLKFVIEKAELTSFLINGDCDLETLTAFCTLQYLNSHSSLEINGEKINFELDHSYTDHDHLVIHLKSNSGITSINQINIYNNCFYEFDPGFQNRIIIDAGTFQKSFLLDKEKNKIHLSL